MDVCVLSMHHIYLYKVKVQMHVKADTRQSLGLSSSKKPRVLSSLLDIISTPVVIVT